MAVSVTSPGPTQDVRPVRRALIPGWRPSFGGCTKPVWRWSPPAGQRP